MEPPNIIFNFWFLLSPIEILSVNSKMFAYNDFCFYLVFILFRYKFQCDHKITM